MLRTESSVHVVLPASNARHSASMYGEVAFEAMKVAQLKVELAARGSTRTGLKATLQRRLHAMIVQAAIERRRADAMDDGE